MSELYKILGILFLLAYNAALFDYYRKNENYPIERFKILNYCHPSKYFIV
jgi:hypothetical protein